ncbi:hypothetical protein [Mangrovicoccus sp. HB161399]|uniref:hypothetical protein n=1 Tax=Mangrovicoccus sp. HB161399 TaxID=2720392 RepID=UPI001555DA08|nr:hypothetical protein [Mangrovicoccus sp. HB161399]
MPQLEGTSDLLVDSTGIEAEGEGEWRSRRHCGSKRSVWRKNRLGIGWEASEIRTVEISSSDAAEQPVVALSALQQVAAV